MSLIEEARTKIKTRIEAIRGGGSPLGGSILGQGEVSPIKAVREKGVLSVLEEKFPKVKEIRGGGGQGVLGVLGERFPKVKEMRERGILARVLGEKEDKYGLRTEEKGETPPPTTTTTAAYKLRA
jgi:hypothetical protein